MADGDKKVSYQVDASASGFEAGMQKAADSARQATGQIEAQFKRVQDAFASVQKQFLVLAGIVAGGAFFKDAIAASNQMTGETMKLSKALGINGEQASALRTALGDIGADADTYVGAFDKFARQVKSNEKGLNDLGIQTRGANGHLRDSQELFTEALQSVGQYKAGIDQSTYAQTLFGKSLDEVRSLQKLNTDEIEKARKKNEELGLVITQQNVEASKAYKRAMHDVGDVLEAIKKTIGDAVMPVFTEMGEYLASAGPAVIAVFRGSLLFLLGAFEAVKATVKTVAGAIFESISTIVDVGGLLGDVFSKLFKGDFSGAYDAAKGIGTRLGAAVTNTFANFVDAGNDADAAVRKHFDRIFGDKTPAGAPKSGDKRMGAFKEKDAKDTSRVSAWDADLQEQKLAYQEAQNAQGSFQQMSKASELAFWKDKLRLTEAGTAENTAVRKKVAELQLAINEQAYQKEIAGLQAREAAYKNDTDKRLALLDQEQALVAQRFGRESKEYEDVQKRIVEVKRQAVEQQKQLDEMRSQAARTRQQAELDLEIQQAALDRDLHVTTQAEYLQRMQAFEDRRYQIADQALRDRLALAERDPDKNKVEIARINQELEQAEQEHQRRLTEIRGQATRESQRFTLDTYNAIESGWASTIAKLAQGQLTVVGFFRSMWQNVLQAAIGALSQMAAQWLAHTLLAKLLNKTTAASEITGNAGVAASGAYAAMAAIPIIGPMNAPAAAATAFAGAMAYQGVLASAAGGYDIPSNVNPLVQAHAEEMVLPAKYADMIRGMAEGQQPQQPVGDAPLQLIGHPMPGGFWMAHQDAIVKVINDARRNFKLRGV